jgi:PKHD-type hydroxylase
MLTIIENLLDADDLVQMNAQLSDANWIDGAQTAGTRSVAVKQNDQLDRADPVGIALGDMILRKLGHHPLFVSASLAETIWPPMFNRYQNGGHYGTHVDSALMRLPSGGKTMRSDISATLFLSDPERYDGGDLVIEDQYGGQSIKLAAGDMVLYPSSSLHQVTPVTRGQRLAAVTWIHSAVADTAARTMLFELDQTVQALSKTHAKDDPDIERLTQLYHNLLRRWAQV